MAIRQFLTVPDELESLAVLALTHFRSQGFTVSIEKSDIDLPGTPTLTIRRQGVRHFVLLRTKVERQEIGRWVRYCHSCTNDVRLAICFPSSSIISVSDLGHIRNAGVGLYFEEKKGDGDRVFTSAVAGKDLAFNAELPVLEELKPKVRKMIAPMCEEFQNGDWQKAFRDTMGVLEEQCRLYLKANVKLGRAKYTIGSKIVVPTQDMVNKMTLGQIKNVFCGLVQQNQVESLLCSALERLNPLRIKMVHKPSSPSTARSLRKNAGRSMWTIINCLSSMV